MTQCTECLGDGITGSGEKPWEKVGKIVTCRSCNGTGKIEVSEEGLPMPASNVTVQEQHVENVDNSIPAAIDESQEQPGSEVIAPAQDETTESKGILGRLADAILG